MTKEGSIYKALLDMVVALNLTPPLPVVWPNQTTAPPPDGTAYLEVSVFNNKIDRLFLSGGPDRHKGIMQVLLKWPLNQDELPAIDIAGEIVSHFRVDDPYWINGIKVTITERPSIGDGVPTKVSWEVPVSVPYEAFA